MVSFILHRSINLMFVLFLILFTPPGSYSQILKLYEYSAVTGCEDGYVIEGDRIVFRSEIDFNTLPNFELILFFELKGSNQVRFQTICFLEISKECDKFEDYNCYCKISEITGQYEAYLNMSAIVNNSQSSLRVVLYISSEYLLSDIHTLPKILDPLSDIIKLYVDDSPVDVSKCSIVTNKIYVVLVVHCPEIPSCLLTLVDTETGQILNHGTGMISFIIEFWERRQISIKHEICKVPKTVNCIINTEENYSKLNTISETREKQVEERQEKDGKYRNAIGDAEGEFGEGKYSEEDLDTNLIGETEGEKKIDAEEDLDIDVIGETEGEKEIDGKEDLDTDLIGNREENIQTKRDDVTQEKESSSKPKNLEETEETENMHVTKSIQNTPTNKGMETMQVKEIMEETKVTSSLFWLLSPVGILLIIFGSFIILQSGLKTSVRKILKSITMKN